jgi:hypothetical protein
MTFFLIAIGCNDEEGPKTSEKLQPLEDAEGGTNEENEQISRRGGRV